MTSTPKETALWFVARLRSKEGAILAVCFVFLSIVFSIDPFDAVPESFLRKSLGAQDVGRIDPLSESLIHGRAIKANTEEGVGFAEWLGMYYRPGLSSSQEAILSEQMLRNGTSPEARDIWTPYKSEFGLQGMVFTTISSISPFSSSTTLDIIRILWAIALALCMAHLIYWAANQFGYAVAPFLALFLGFSPWLVAFADSPYWVFFLAFLPLNISLHFLMRESRGSTLPLFSFSAWLFLAFLIKALCGYVYFSAIIAASAIPLIFYWVYGQISPQQVMMRSAGIAVAGISAFSLSFVVLSLRNSYYEGASFGKALTDSINMSLRRTLASGDDGAQLGSNFAMEPIERTQNSLDAPISEVVQVYFTQDIFVGIPFWAFAAFCISLGVLIISGREFLPSIAARRRDLFALYTTFIISICAPLTWYILAKAHAYIHTFWSMAIWYVPTMFFAALFAVCILKYLAIDVAGHLKIVSVGTLRKNANAKLAMLIFGVIIISAWIIQSVSEEQMEKRTTIALSEGQKYSLSKGWDAVIYKDWIYIIAKQCPFTSQRNSIRLEVTGSDSDGRLTKRNLDYGWQRQTVSVQKRNQKDNRCVTRRLLPDLSIRSILIAEDSPIYGVLWQAKVEP